MLAPPITFEIDGVQYLSILTGSGGGDLFGGEPLPPVAEHASLTYNNYGRLLVFSLGGTESIPIPSVRDRSIPAQVVTASVKDIAAGEIVYNEVCAVCHGLAVRSGGSIPDLRRMSEGTHEIFNQIVLDGLLSARGMAGFSDTISEQDSTQIHAYVRARAEQDRLYAAGEVELPQLTWLSD
jgi:mono/diheme cytochrome c family protein